MTEHFTSVSRGFRAEPGAIRLARDFVAIELGRLGASPRVVADFQLAASELATNVVEHSPHGAIRIAVEATPAQWVVAVTGGRFDPSAVGEPATWSMSTPLAHSGRGLGIVRRVMHDIAVERSGPWTRIRCEQAREP